MTDHSKANIEMNALNIVKDVAYFWMQKVLIHLDRDQNVVKIAVYTDGTEHADGSIILQRNI